MLKQKNRLTQKRGRQFSFRYRQVLQLFVALGAIAAAKEKPVGHGSIAFVLVVCVRCRRLHAMISLMVLRKSLGYAVLRLTQPTALELNLHTTGSGVPPEGVAK